MPVQSRKNHYKEGNPPADCGNKFHQIQQTLQTLRLVPGRQEIRLGHSENLSDDDEAWEHANENMFLVDQEE